MKYTEFVKQFSGKNSGLKGPELMKAAAAEWKKYKAATSKSQGSKSEGSKSQKKSQKKSSKKTPKKTPKKTKSKGGCK